MIKKGADLPAAAHLRRRDRRLIAFGLIGISSALVLAVTYTLLNA